MTGKQRDAVDKIPGTLRYTWPNGTISWTGEDGWGYLILPDGTVAKRWLADEGAF